METIRRDGTHIAQRRALRLLRQWPLRLASAACVLSHHGATAISRRDPQVSTPLSQGRGDDDRAYLLDHQTGCDEAQPDGRDQRDDRTGRIAYRCAETPAHDPRAGGNVLCGASRSAIL